MSDGTLLELVSRGKKDAYFTQNPQRTWFATDYSKRTPAVQEYYREELQGGSLFGQLVEVAIPNRAELLTEVELRITLPTWLPPSVAARNRDPATTVRIGDQSLICGWINDIGNRIITRWALFGDGLQLMEGTGESTGIYHRLSCDQFRAPILNDENGFHDGSTRGIQWNATPPELAVRIPIIGCQGGTGGLPLGRQNYLIRLWFAPKSELVEAVTEGGQRVIGFTPWDLKTVRVNGEIEAVTRTQIQMGAPTVYAILHYKHLADDLRQAVLSRRTQIPFREFPHQSWRFTPKEWNTGSPIMRSLDLSGLFQALIIRFQYSSGRQISTEWLTDLQFNVNGEPLVNYNGNPLASTLLNNCKFRRDIPRGLYFLVFGTEEDGEPAGTLNLTETTSNRALLILTPNTAIDPEEIECTVFGISWNLFETQGGSGKVMFLN